MLCFLRNDGSNEINEILQIIRSVCTTCNFVVLQHKFALPLYLLKRSYMYIATQCKIVNENFIIYNW